MDLTVMAKDILAAVGGKDNILRNSICATRLKLEIREKEKADLSRLRSIHGVLGFIEADHLQIIVDSRIVSGLGMKFSALSGLELTILSSEEIVEKKASFRRKRKERSFFQTFFALFKRR